MDPLSLPVRASWRSMMAAKLASALRPRRLALFVVSSCALGLGIAMITSRPILESAAVVVIVLGALRLVAMAGSAALDVETRRRFTGMLTLAGEGLELEREDGTSEAHPWSWVLEARMKPDVLELRIDERGGRVWVRFSLARLADRGVHSQLDAHLRAAGKIRSASHDPARGPVGGRG